MAYKYGSRAPKTYLEKINKTLNRSIKTILFKQKYDTVELFFKYLGIPTLKKPLNFSKENSCGN